MTNKPLSIYAAGSLRFALPEIASAFTAITGVAVERRHGPAGIMREKIEAGDRPDLYMSADIGHPIRLAEVGISGSPILFARNRMMATVRRAAGITSANFIDKLVEPSSRIGTSTPIKDAGGDYAWAIFKRVDRLLPGAFALLTAKAQQLVGGSEVISPPGTIGPITRGLADGSIDFSFGYFSNVMGARPSPGIQTMEIPDEINVVPEYGMAVLNGAAPAAHALAAFVMSFPAQRLLKKFGFTPVTLSFDDQ